MTDVERRIVGISGEIEFETEFLWAQFGFARDEIRTVLAWAVARESVGGPFRREIQFHRFQASVAVHPSQRLRLRRVHDRGCARLWEKGEDVIYENGTGAAGRGCSFRQRSP